MTSIALALLLSSAPLAGPEATRLPDPARALETAPQLRLGSGAVLAADTFGRIHRSEDGGRTWEPSHAGLPVPLLRQRRPALLASDPARPDTVYALLDATLRANRVSTLLFRSRDGGRTWAAVKEIPRGEWIDSLAVENVAGPVVHFTGVGRRLSWADSTPAEPPLRGAESFLARGDRDPRLPLPDPPAGLDVDLNGIAILEDDGTFWARNDVAARAMQFAPAGGGAYAGYWVAASGIVASGTDLVLADDEIRAVPIPFSFPFYGANYTTAHVSSNGNLTLGAADPNPDFQEHSFLLAIGPPRIAAMWDDLDPTQVGAQVLVDSQPARLVITWLAVPEFGLSTTNTFQLTLEPSGLITIQWGALAAFDGLVGITPGGGATNYYGDLTVDAPFTVPAGAGVYEWYFLELWTDRVARRFYDCHADAYDQLVIWGSRDYPYYVAGEDYFAFADVVRNDTQGLGYSTFDFSPTWGSSSVLRTAIGFGRTNDYPDDPQQNFAIDANGLDILAQMVGQQWGAYVTWDQDLAGPIPATYDLLGRGAAHWSFFYDSAASVMEGNLYRDNGNGTYTTVEADERYGPLDLYLMGLVPEAAVPPTTLLTSVTDPGLCFPGVDPCLAISPPEPGVTVTSSTTPVTIDQITFPNGPRNPAAGNAPNPLRQAWILVLPPGVPLNPADEVKVNNYRTQWGAYFPVATGGLGSLDTTLIPRPFPTPPAPVGNNLWQVRSFDSVVLDWRNGTTSPRRYIIHGTDTKTQLGDSTAEIGSQPVLGTRTYERMVDPGAIPTTPQRPALFFYEVHNRDCQDATVFP